MENYKLGNKTLIYSAILAFILIFLCSCDIHKEAQKSKVDTEVKTEAQTTTNTQSENNAFKTSFSIEPIDLSKPITFGGKTYTNAKIVYINEKSNTKENKTENKKENKQVNQSVKEKQSVKTEKANFDWLLYLVFGLFFLLLIVVVVVVIYFKSQINRVA